MLLTAKEIIQCLKNRRNFKKNGIHLLFELKKINLLSLNPSEFSVILIRVFKRYLPMYVPIYFLFSKFLRSRYKMMIIKIIVYISGIPNSVKLFNINEGDILFSKFFIN